MRIIACMLFVLCAYAAPALAECDVELKPTDGYRELSEKLKCLKNEIAALKGAGSTGSAADAYERAKARAQGAREAKVELRALNDCLITEQILGVTKLRIEKGGKFCRENGSIWMRVISVGASAGLFHYVLPDSRTESSHICREAMPSCEFTDSQTGQRIRLQVEAGSIDGRSVLLGTLQKL